MGGSDTFLGGGGWEQPWANEIPRAKLFFFSRKSPQRFNQPSPPDHGVQASAMHDGLINWDCLRMFFRKLAEENGNSWGGSGGFGGGCGGLLKFAMLAVVLALLVLVICFWWVIVVGEMLMNSHCGCGPHDGLHI